MKRMRVVAQETSLKDKLEMLRPQMVEAAQAIYNQWEQDEEGVDIEYGGGGICDQINQAIQGIIVGNIEDIDVMEGGQEGDDHSWTIAYTNREAYGIDIPASVYESGGGYRWTKLEDIAFEPDDVEIFSVTDYIDIDELRIAKDNRVRNRRRL